jgi:hypothetical protein
VSDDVVFKALERIRAITARAAAGRIPAPDPHPSPGNRPAEAKRTRDMPRHGSETDRDEDLHLEAGRSLEARDAARGRAR